jgi:hypothetical protein
MGFNGSQRPRNIFPLCPEADSGYRFMPARSSTASPSTLFRSIKRRWISWSWTRRPVGLSRSRLRGLSVRVGLDADAEPSSPSTSTIEGRRETRPATRTGQHGCLSAFAGMTPVAMATATACVKFMQLNLWRAVSR